MAMPGRTEAIGAGVATRRLLSRHLADRLLRQKFDQPRELLIALTLIANQVEVGA